MASLDTHQPHQPDRGAELLTQRQLSEKLHVSERTLERMRGEGRGPRFMKAGRRVLYARADVERWLDENTFASTAEVGC